jgi:hypothetical protein
MPRLISKLPRIHTIISAATITFVFLSYLPGLSSEFFIVDDLMLTQAPQLALPASLFHLNPVFFVGDHVDFYPFRDLSILFDHLVFGPRSYGPMRIQNFLWLLTSTALLYQLLRATNASKQIAVCIGCLWFLHPVHSEILMWISSRKDVLALVLTLLAVAAFLIGRQRKKNLWIYISLLLFVFGLLSKASFGLLPAAVLLWCVALRKWDFRKPELLVLGLASGLGLANSSLQSWIYTAVNDMRFYYSWDYRVGASAAALGKAFMGLFWPPFNIVDVENWSPWLALNSQFVVVGVTLWILFLGLVAYAFKKQKSTMLLMLLVAGALYAPVSGLAFEHRNFYSVRYFEPLWALMTVATGLALSKSKFFKTRLGSVLLVFTAIYLGYFTIKEGQVWSDHKLVWAKALADSPDSTSLKNQYYLELLRESSSTKLSANDQKKLASLKRELTIECDQNGKANPACLSYYRIFAFAQLDGRPVEQLDLSYIKKLKELYSTFNPRSGERAEAEFYFRLGLRNGAVDSDAFKKWARLTPYKPMPEQRFVDWSGQCLFGGQSQGKARYDHYLSARLIEPIEFKYAVKRATHVNLQPRLLACLH